MRKEGLIKLIGKGRGAKYELEKRVLNELIKCKIGLNKSKTSPK